MPPSRRPKRLTRFPIPLLRPYQREVARAILAAVRAGDGRTLSVQIARQGGKNEVSAQVELLLLLAAGAGDLIKVAPSLRPQGLISLNRLWSRLRECGLAPPAARQGNAIVVGENRLLLLSAASGANVVGHTAGALMEVDEAQDVDAERFSRDFRPMGASRATATIFYGTPWTETSLLEEMKQRHIEMERQDGIRRHFEYGWQVVAAANPAYERFAQAERERLGEQHPAWRTQYCLETVPGAGLLFTPPQRALMQGAHRRFRARTRELEPGAIAAGLDVAAEAFRAGGDQDQTVLTLLHVLPPHLRPLSVSDGEERTDPYPGPLSPEATPAAPSVGEGERGWQPGDLRPSLGSPASAWGGGGRRQPGGLGVSPKTSSSLISSSLGWGGEEADTGLPQLWIVEQLAWRGASHDALLAELTPLIARVWRPEALAIDATGVGEGLAAALEARLTALRGGRTRVLRERISEQVKSRLGFGLLAAAGGRLRCYADDGSPEYREFWAQVSNARATYKPNRLMSFGVDPARGHDDYLMSLALAVEAAGLAQPRVARGRRAEAEGE